MNVPRAGTFHIQAQERIVFGVPAGEAVVAEADRVGAKRVFVTSTRSLMQKEDGPLQRLEKALGSRITRLTPVQGFCAETGGALTLFGATWLGIPVSTTHTITGAIVGVGAARRVSAVRWNVASNIVVAWVITMPASGLIAAITHACAAWLA